MSTKKKILRELRESEAFLRTIFETEPECVQIVSDDGRLLQLNPAGLGMIEADALNDVLGHSVYSFIAPEHRMAFGTLIERVALGYREMLEFEVVGLKGTRRSVEASAVPLRASDGKFSAVLCVVSDVTRRKMDEVALRRSEQKYHDIFAFAPVGIYQTNRDGTFVTANAMPAEILGYDSPEELLRRNIGRDIYQDERETLIELYEQSGKAENLEILWKKKDGSPLWIQLNAHAVKNTEGRTEYFKGFVLDIDVRKQAELNLRESEERFRSLVDNAHDVIFSLSRDAVFTSLNPVFERSTGWEREDWLGKSFTSLIHPQDLPSAVEMFQQAINGRPTPLYELRARTKSGEFLVGEFTSTPQWSSGKITGVIGIVRDVSERAKL